MAQRSENDFDGHPARGPRKRKSFPVWTWVAIGVSTLTLLGVGCMGALLYSVGKVRNAAKQQQAKLKTRDEFKTMLMGKTKDEVVTMLGRPHQTTDRAQGADWTYERLTFDPVSGKPDSLVRITFDDGGRVISTHGF